MKGTGISEVIVIHPGLRILFMGRKRKFPPGEEQV